jgi:hypothetical protein
MPTCQAGSEGSKHVKPRCGSDTVAHLGMRRYRISVVCKLRHRMGESLMAEDINDMSQKAHLSACGFQSKACSGYVGGLSRLTIGTGPLAISGLKRGVFSSWWTN